MNIEFATCNRHEALQRIQEVYPEREIKDTPESAGPLLDFVEADIVRIQDPMMYGNRIGVVRGKKYQAADGNDDAIKAAATMVATAPKKGKK